MTRLAVYGKGGIGKSTFSANLSVALAERGHMVLQVGCDPKHDSTRFLLHGTQPTTVLDYLRETAPAERRLEDVLVPGYKGIGCVEAGGPRPGVGCAGRGIISTFELLEQFDLNARYDTTVYDVLGDVVCGGFAVPIRREYADTILIVTSGEFMALYAANNILKGIRNYDGQRARVAGLVCNCRNVEDEAERVQRFADAVGLPVFVTIPRSNAFARAEDERVTVMEHGQDAGLMELFRRAAARLDEDAPLFCAHPVEDEELEQIYQFGSLAAAGARSAPLQVDGTQDADASCHPERSPEGEVEESPTAGDGLAGNRYLSKSVANREPMHGCAFNGAMGVACQLVDAQVLAHSPASCAFLSLQTTTSAGRRSLFNRGTLLPAAIAPNLNCTNMGEPELVFGGMERLEEAVLELKARKPRAIIVVSSCPAGIIGDDVDTVCDFAEPDMPIVAIKANGNMSGDYQQGIFFAYEQIAHGFVKRDVPKVPKTVNVIGEKGLMSNCEDNFRTIEGYLQRLGLRVNARFLSSVRVDELERFCSAELTLPAYLDYTAQMPIRLFTEEYGVEVFERAFPVGFDDTCDWLRGIAERFGTQEQAEELITELATRAERAYEELRPALAGKRLMVITYSRELDWVLKTALSCGMEIVKVGVLDYSQDEGFRTTITEPLDIDEHYDPSKRDEDIRRLRPDVLLTNYASSMGEHVPVADVIPMIPDVGFESGIMMARRWARLLKLDLKGGWHDDAELYRRYCTR